MATSMLNVCNFLWLGDPFPDFECDTTQGKLHLHDYWGNGWGMLFTFPTMFGDPVSTMELRTVSSLLSEFTKRNVKCIALSCDTVKWIGDNQKCHDNPSFGYPIICDPSNYYIIKLGIQDPAEIDRVGYKVSGRAVIIVGLDKCIKAFTCYPAATGLDFNEVLRVIDSLQLCADKKVETPENWKSGDDVIVQNSVSDEDATKMFPQHVVKEVPSGKKYMRITPQP